MVSALKKFISSCLAVGIVVCALAAFGGYKLWQGFFSEPEAVASVPATEVAPVVPAQEAKTVPAPVVPAPAENVVPAAPASTLDGERKKARARLMEIRVSVKTEMRRLEGKRRSLELARSGGANAERTETLTAEVESSEQTLKNLREEETEIEAKIRELDTRALRERESKPFSHKQ